MKRAVVLAGVYYPTPSPTGTCAKRIVDILKKNFEVCVVFIKTNSTNFDGEMVDGVRLYTVDSWLSSSTYRLSEPTGKGFEYFRTILAASSNLVLRGLGRLAASTTSMGPLFWYKKKTYAILNAIHKESRISYVISVCSPFPAHLVAMDFHKKYPCTTWVTYTVDPFSVPDVSLEKRRWKGGLSERRRKAEKVVYAAADHNLVSEEIFTEYHNLFKETKAKVTAVPYIIKPMKREEIKERSEKRIILLYAGRFYRSFRNPEYLFKTFLEAAGDRLVLHLYSTSDCDDLIKKYIRISNGRIILFPTVSPEEITRKMQAADILVSVGNNSDAFKPSKIFTYLASGKPIVHFHKEAARDSVFDMYPLSLQLSQDQGHFLENARKLKAFCLGITGKSISPDEISRIYPDNSEEHFSELLFTALSSKMGNVVVPSD